MEALLEPADPWTVSYAPSATVLAYFRRQPKIDRTGAMLALGDPVFFDTGRAPQNESPGDRAIVSARQGPAVESLPGTRREVEALSRLFLSVHQPARILTDTMRASREMYELAASGDLGRFAFIHLATHGSIDERSPQRSAVILTQTDLPDPLTQVLNKRPAYDGRLDRRRRSSGIGSSKPSWSRFLRAKQPEGNTVAGKDSSGLRKSLLMAGRSERLPIALEG